MFSFLTFIIEERNTIAVSTKTKSRNFNTKKDEREK